MKIQYICQWGKDKERTWSGTTYSLYTALKSNVDNIIDFNIDFNKFENLAMRLAKLTCYKGKIGATNQFNYLSDYIKQQKIDEADENILSLQVGCFGKLPNTYIYEDLSASALEYVYHNNLESFKKSNFSKSNIKSIKRKVKRQNSVYRTSKGIFTMSHWVTDIIKQSAGIENVYCVGGGINLDPQTIDFSKKTGNKFLFVGRDFERKGGDLVVDAFVKLQQQYNELELYIAGTTNIYQKEFENIIWLGDLSKKELVEYFNKCDIFCLPSEFEAYGLVFPEALCFGMPCIGRDHYEMPYFIKHGENGYLLKNADVDELYLLMKKAIFDKTMQQKVRNQKLSYLNMYSWDAVAKRILSIISETSTDKV